MASAPPHASARPDDSSRRLMARLSPGVIAGLVLSALWLLAGGAARLFGSDIIATRLLSFLGIGPAQTQIWSFPGAWAAVMLLLSAAVLTSVTALIADRAVRTGQAFLVLWLGAILAGTALGLCMDAVRALSFLPDSGLRGLTAAVVETAPVTTYWAVAWGWLPALLLHRRASDTAASTSVRPRVLAALLCAVLFVALGGFADEARRQEIIRENAAQQGITDESGAFVDPLADGDPVPDTAPGASAPEWGIDGCTSDRAMMLLGASDAATGHRAQIVHLMNFSDEPCVIEGYPDVAFADQNGHLLEVDVQKGSSFLAVDPGSTPITVPAQGQATAVIGWDANSTQGALVARQLYAAALPGLERGPWPVELDVTAGSTVEVTAWHLGPAPGANP